ncbi:FdhF/YdeP family oxidoreductase [Haloglycomyces albus]|uniref:FdhF/YdeP family oxidoreductase n=1 Tax=Haloglycomyces albus TaxID=526067 RepID=UPI00046D339E|nr:FdhF/YdeP family oxidoreductase [Haloglycomyces albus]
MTKGSRAKRLKISSPEDDAVGIPAVVNSIWSAQKQMGPRRWFPILKALNKDGGIDCPSCAWPDPERRRPAEFCENGAKAIAEEATARGIGADFFARHSVEELSQRSGYWLGQQGRLTEPLYLDADATHYRPISWEEAYALVADELDNLDSPDQAVFYTSGRTGNEAAFLYQLFARKLGTNNLPDCSNMCHESTSSALSETIGIGKGSVLFDDFHHTDLIVVVGQNPGTNHPRMLTTLEEAKRQGARIVSINPLPETGLERYHDPQSIRGLVGPGTQLSDLHLPIRVGGDLALFSALNRSLIEAEAVDGDFIETYTDGYHDYSEALLSTPAEEFWEKIDDYTGLARYEIDQLLSLIQRSRSVIVCWAMGLTQHEHSVPTLREVVNHLLLRGNIGKPGSGLCPVRGHSNVQGDRTMGIWERPPRAFLDALAREFDFEPPREDGLDTVNAIRAMRAGEVRFFMAMGGNFVSAGPDTEVTEAAMRNCELSVQVSTKLNRSHVVTGRRALILPALGRTDRDHQAGGEQFVTVEDSFSKVHTSQGKVAPIGRTMKSEPAIVCDLAEAVFGADDSIEWSDLKADYDRIRDHISRIVPGFEDFNRRVREPNGFTLPHPPRDSRTFPTDTGRANLTSNRLRAPSVKPDELILQTLRSHDQFNTTIYGLNDRYRGVHHGRQVVFVNPVDATRRSLEDGATVDLISIDADGKERRASRFRLVHYPTAKGCAAAYYPETNVLVSLDSVAEQSNTPASKSVPIRLERSSVVARS